MRWLLAGLGGVVLLLLLTLAGLWLLVSTNSGSSWVLERVLNRLNTGGQLTVAVGETEGTLLRGLKVEQVNWHQGPAEVALRSLEAEWNPFSLLAGRLIIARLAAEELQVSVSPSTPRQPGEALLAEFSLNPLPVNLQLDQLTVTAADIVVGDFNYHLDRLQLGAALTGRNLELTALQLQSPLLDADGEATLELNGRLPLSATLNWHYRGDLLTALHGDWTEAAGAAAIQGDWQSLSLENQWQLPLQFASRGALQTGLYDAEAGLNFDFQHETGALQLPYAVLADTGFSAVQLRTAGSIDRLQLELATRLLVPGYPEYAGLATGLLADAALQIDQLQLTSDTGSLQSSGTIQLSSPVSGSFDYQLVEAQPLDYAPGSLPVLLENLRSNGTLEFVVRDAGVDGELRVAAVDARLGDYDVTGAGSLRRQDSQWFLDDLQLNSVGTQVAVKGSLGDELDLDWQLEVGELGQLLSGAAGAVSGQGQLQGPATEPDLQFIAQGQGLAYGPWRLADTRMQANGQAGRYTASLTIRGLEYPNGNFNEQIENLTLQLNGSRAQHLLQGTLHSNRGDLELEASGGFVAEGWRDWRGSVNRADFSSAFGHWQTDQTANVTVAGTQLTLSEACWRREVARVCLRGSGDAAADFSLNATLRDLPLELFNAAVDPATTADLSGLPHLPDNVSLAGMLEADLSFALHDSRNYDADVNLRSNETVLTVRSSPDNDDAEADESGEQQYLINTLQAEGQARNNSWTVNGLMDFSRGDIDDTDLNLQGRMTADLAVDPDLNLAGRVSLDVGDLGWLAALVPDINNVAGQLRGEAQLAGTVTEPQWRNGEFDILGGAATVPALGIQIFDVQARLSSPTTQAIALDGSARSGSGSLQFNGNLDELWSPQRHLLLVVTGSDFQLLDRDDIGLTVTPGLRITANQQAVNLSGELLIPQLDLTVSSLSESAVEVSRDAVIVSYPPDRPDLARSIAAEENTFYNIPVTTDLLVTLGDAVNFTGFGLNARLDGELSIRQGEDSANLTYGELTVQEGTYNAYNTELTLERGKLLFFGAYDNPALDIRAAREVENLTAGLQINGTLKNINSQLYSSPALPDNDIIAVLITGKPFAQISQQDGAMLLSAVAGLGLERGEGLTNQIRDKLGLDALSVDSTGDINNSILTIGKYLSPSLFVRYGVGLFDSQSTVAVDYKVSDNITLQAESGEYQSVDLSYRIER